MNPTALELDDLRRDWLETRIRRALAERLAGYAVDEDGQLDETARVLAQKRGCRR